MSDIIARYRALEAKLCQAAGGRDVHLLPVTKTRPAEEINELLGAGICDIGENRVQEFLQKKPYLTANFRLHHIGQLQTNKVQGIIEDVVLVQSVDRARLAQEIERQAGRIGRVVPVLVQVNIAGEEQKAGVAPEEFWQLVECVVGCPHLALRGIMTIAPLYDDPERARPVFAKARALYDKLHEQTTGIDTLSMGMSEDGFVAAQEGATLVRMGSAIFGPRPIP